MAGQIITPFTVWRLWTTVSLHFKPGSSYDAIKFRFKNRNTNRAGFDKARTKYVFEKLAKKYRSVDTIIHFLLANLTVGQSFIGDMTHENYLAWLARKESFIYLFEKEVRILRKVSPTFNGLFEPDGTGNSYITLMGQYYEGTICLETLTALHAMVGFADRKIDEDDDHLGLTANNYEFIRAYGAFIPHVVDLAKCKEIVIKIFTPTLN